MNSLTEIAWQIIGKDVNESKLLLDALNVAYDIVMHNKYSLYKAELLDQNNKEQRLMVFEGDNGRVSSVKILG